MFINKEFNEMLRGFPLSVTVILLLSSGAFAAIGHAEGFSIGALNMVQKVGGAGWAEGGNLVMVGQSQEVYAVGTLARQKQAGLLNQSASVYGTCGITKVLQNVSADGLQNQLVVSGRRGFQAQGQSLTVGLDNIIRKTGGVGGASGEQGFVGGQRQVLVTPNGTSANSQVVEASQLATVSGCRASNILVKSNLDVQMEQNQIATAGYALPKPKLHH